MTAWTSDDAEKVCRDLLTAAGHTAFSDRPQYTGAPMVQVEVDATSINYPVEWDYTMRLTAWCPDRDDAILLAQRAAGVLADATGGGALVRSKPVSGLTVAPDDTTPAWLASILCSVTLRGVPLV